MVPEANRLELAEEFVEWAWHRLPGTLRGLLENISAAGWAVHDRPLGGIVSSLLVSNGGTRLPAESEVDYDDAIGVWMPKLRVVLVSAAHPALDELDERSYTRMIAETAWHEWAHALSLDRATRADIRRGRDLLTISPPGVADRIRAGGYRPGEYTHEIVASTFATLMFRREGGGVGRPDWLNVELWNLIERVTGWSE